MHECWNCGQACDCDGEDAWFESGDNVDMCIHECEEEDEEEDD